MPLTRDPKPAPKSVSAATRFTATSPHSASRPQASSRTPPASASAATSSGRAAAAAAAAGNVGPIETPEQRVARLRAAHLAAKRAQVSRFDAVIDSSRKFFDAAHKVTVMGLVGFSVIAALGTVYTIFDMMAYNRKRKGEFVAVQKQAQQNSLETARLAYMRGDATVDQIEMVEDANAREAAAGSADGGAGGAGIFNLPKVLSLPKTIEKDEPPAGSAAAAAAVEGGENGSAAAAAKSGGWFSMFSRRPQGGEGGQAANKEPAVQRSLEEKYDLVRQKAREAFDKEMANQSEGGAFDRVGATTAAAPAVPAASESAPKKKGWW